MEKTKLIAVGLILLGSVRLCGQYTGPAMLTRGELPQGVQPAQIDFRPYLNLNGIFDSGMQAVSATGGSSNLIGLEASFGVYGVHRWKRTTLGLDYRGSLRHYQKNSYYDGSDHTISLGLTRQTTRHTTLSIRESAGTYTRSFGMFAFGGMGTFDATQGYIPANDFFDNRTDFLSNQVDLTYHKSARMAFSVGGDLYLVHYRSKALYGLTGAGARGDMTYRISRHSTFGIGYNYQRYRFSRDVGGTDVQSLVGSYGIRFTKNLELSLYGGFSEVESQFVRAVQLDPAIASLLGVTAQLALTHRIDHAPQAGARLTRSFRHAHIAIGGSYGVTPGNGIFLSSKTASANAEYSYSGLRRWNFGISGGYSRAESISDIVGNYGFFSTGAGATRQVSRWVHFTARFDVRRFASGTYSAYNRLPYRATIGFAFTPKDIPLVLW